MKTFNLSSRFLCRFVLVLATNFVSVQSSFAQGDPDIQPAEDLCISAPVVVSVTGDIASWTGTSADNLYHFKLQDRLSSVILDEHNVVGTSTVMNGLIIGVTYRVAISPACNSGLIDVAHETYIDFVKSIDGIIHGDIQIRLAAPSSDPTGTTLDCTFERIRSSLETGTPFNSGDVCEVFNTTLQTAHALTEPYKQLILTPQNSVYATHILGLSWLNVSTAVNTRFDNYIVASIQNRVSLPVKLVRFKAVANQQNVTLTWATASERNTKSFQIQRSTNGVDFVAIGQVEAAGNANTMQNYRFDDKKPLLGTNFYRLNMIDSDDKSEISPIESVFFHDKNTWCQIQPTLVNSSVSVTILDDNMDTNTAIRLTNALGDDLLQQNLEAGVQHINIPLDNLPAGVYYIYLQKDRMQHIQKLVKK